MPPPPHFPPAAVRRALRKVGADIYDARRRRRLPMAVVLDTSKPAATRAIEVLAEIGILMETTGESATTALLVAPIWNVCEPARNWTSAAEWQHVLHQHAFELHYKHAH